MIKQKQFSMVFVRIVENSKEQEVSIVKNRNRIMAILLSVIVFLAMLCSSFYIAEEANHDCIGENCPICDQIRVCQNSLKTLSLAVSAVMSGIVLTYLLCRCRSARSNPALIYTLVSLKVKLLD